MVGEYDFDGNGECELLLDGRFAMAETYVNGFRVEYTLSNKKNITEYLKQGKNEIIVKVNSSLRNLFGPLHFAEEKEPLVVTPFAFNMRGSWENGESKWYTSEYNCVPFGIDNVFIIQEY